MINYLQLYKLEARKLPALLYYVQYPLIAFFQHASARYHINKFISFDLGIFTVPYLPPLGVAEVSSSYPYIARRVSRVPIRPSYNAVEQSFERL